MVPRLLSLTLLAVGCAQAPADAPVAPASAAQWRTKEDGGTNGFYDYCDGAVLCALGEGDCDADTQCEAGLACIDDLGNNFGLHWTTDICAGAHCGNGVQDGDETAVDFGGSCGGTCGGTPGDHDYCRPGCPCAVGGGDCDTDAECQAGLVCGENLGAQFGLHWSVDVCIADHCSNGVQDADETAIDFGGADCGTTCGGQNGDPNGYCTPGCPCGYGEGDCDSDLDCEPGLSCRLDMGARFGIDPLHEVCLSTFAIGDLLPGDVIVTEFMTTPVNTLLSQGQYFEVYNTTNNEVDLNGLHVRDNSNLNFSVGVPLLVPPRGHVVFGRTTAAAPGAVDFDYTNVFFIAEATETLILEAGAGGTELDRVSWTTAWPRQAGRSRVLGRNRYASDNGDAANWCIPQQTFSTGDYGSPGAINRICP